MSSLADNTCCTENRVTDRVAKCVAVEASSEEKEDNRLNYKRYQNWWELIDKPGFVVDNHSSRPAIAHRLKQPTRFQREPRLNFEK